MCPIAAKATCDCCHCDRPIGGSGEFLIGYFVRKSKGSMCSISASEVVHDTFEDGVSEAEQEKEFRYLTSNRDQP